VPRYLIVNGDDFGASRGINLGIMAAHHGGIVTSTSLMVNAPAVDHAVALGRAAPELSVGLHVDLPGDGSNGSAGGSRPVQSELRAQFARFQELMGRPPTHLDSHHNVHRDPQVVACFVALARERGLPLREHSRVRYFSKFYGQWGGETHLEQISVEMLASMLRTEIRNGVTELSCHPGYVDQDHPTGYAAEREAELRTLCDPRIRQTLVEESIRLVSYRDLDQLPAGTSD
jgi:predicted glycoside hydrolase/deacetylase ChbG (UPF0249 family)